MKKGLDDKNYIEALNKSHFGSKKILDDVIKENQLDAICGLTMGPACSIDTYMEIVGDVFLTTPAAASGYPHISALRKVYELPIGFSFFGTA
jgi:amidase